jgi:uncharacterized protein YoxC
MIAITVVAFRPATAQLIVFDPNNYAQSVLTAARALQQINNQIVSLQNEAQMLINQAKNLAALPFSSLSQLEQSIKRTQQLLAQAQRIAYDIQQIDRAFSTTYAPASSSFGPSIDRERTKPLAECACQPPGRHADTGDGRRQPRYQPHPDVRSGHLKPRSDRCVASNPGRQSATGAASPATSRSYGRRRSPWARTES